MSEKENNEPEISKDILPKAGAGQEGTDELIDTYLKDTPGQYPGIKSFRNFIKSEE